MHARKLILTVLLAGPVLGIMAGLAVDPTMQPSPEPLWRQAGKAVPTPSEAYYQIEPPQDLSPYAGNLRALLMARRFAADTGRYAPEPIYAPAPSEPVTAASQEVAELAAEAADQARLAANPEAVAGSDAGLVPAAPPAAPEVPASGESEAPAVVL